MFLIFRRDGNVIMLGYGSELKEGEWKHFTRDLMKDIQKGLGKKAFLNYKRRAQGIAIDDLTLEGVGCITNVSLANQEYFQLFLKSADWLVKHQVRKTLYQIELIISPTLGFQWGLGQRRCFQQG